MLSSSPLPPLPVEQAFGVPHPEVFCGLSPLLPPSPLWIPGPPKRPCPCRTPWWQGHQPFCQPWPSSPQFPSKPQLEQTGKLDLEVPLHLPQWQQATAVPPPWVAMPWVHPPIPVHSQLLVFLQLLLRDHLHHNILGLRVVEGIPCPKCLWWTLSSHSVSIHTRISWTSQCSGQGVGEMRLSWEV